jgi:glucosamine-6-phosphate deaminase
MEHVMSGPVRSLETVAGSVEIHPDAASASRAAAERVVGVIRESIAARGRAVLGLATGGSPIAVYHRLVELHRAGGLSFRDVVTYNLDEYYPIAPTDANSYRSYMQRHLFDHVDLPPNRAHVLDGTVPEAFVAAQAAAFDRWIAEDGGLDLQLLGIGRNGHIGFNEPSDRTVAEALALPTRLEHLHPVTLADAARDFGGDPGRVPRRALTVGTATILGARSILVLAFGPNKTEAVSRALRGPVTAELPGSLLQAVATKVTWLLDPPAAGALG